jgi:uncharacterized Zn-finger protein
MSTDLTSETTLKHSCPFPDYNKDFKKREKLNTRIHKQAPIKSKPIVEKHFCEVCRKYFSTKGNLKNHSELHKDLKYECAVEGCGKQFNTKARLKVHFKKHVSILTN